MHKEAAERQLTDPHACGCALVQDKDGTGEPLPLPPLRLGSWITLHNVANPGPVGDITAAELGQVMRELGLNPSDAELNDLVNEADLNNDGVISFDGMPAASRNKTVQIFWPGG
jgi:hypothetical protein